MEEGADQEHDGRGRGWEWGELGRRAEKGEGKQWRTLPYVLL